MNVPHLYGCAAVGRRALPAIPMTTTTMTTPNTAEHHQETFQSRRSTEFEDDGHYTDIHFNVPRGGGAARIPTWRRSFVDEPDHYNYLEFNVEQRQRERSSGGYQGLDRGDMSPPRQPAPPDHYTGIRSNQSRSTVDFEGRNLEPVEPSENVQNHGSLEQEPSEDPAAGTLEEHRGEQGYQGLDPSAVEELRRPQRPHSYAGIETATDRSVVHSYLEVIGYSEEDTEGSITEDNSPPLTQPSGETDDSPGEVGVSRGDYEGLDPDEVEEARRRAAEPRDYTTLNLEDLYSRPIKKR